MSSSPILPIILLSLFISCTGGASLFPLPTDEDALETSNMLYIAGGTFDMGSTSGNLDELPIHSVTVRSFYMSKYEVTQKLYKEVMGNNPSGFLGQENNPVDKVSWYDAVAFCNELSKLKGFSPVYTIRGPTVTANWDANGYRLPTEAEWEYAARGGNKSKGYTYSGSNSVNDVAWYRANSDEKPHPVGIKKSNELGVYDMSGNVWEWCWDWYNDYPIDSQSDPRGPVSGQNRLLRGGSWFSDVSYTRPSVRNDFKPTDRTNNLGFRLFRSSDR